MNPLVSFAISDVCSPWNMPRYSLLVLLGMACDTTKTVEVDSNAPTDSAPAPAADTAHPTGCATPSETTCAGQCTDTNTDPYNCGGCGIVCVVPNGEGACDAGVCAPGTCDDGWGDCDGRAGNGCETEADCAAATECRTACDSVGTLDCADVCAPTCLPPVETCNHADDNCDGACDEGALAGCRQGVHRSVGPLGHMYSNDLGELNALGQTTETANYFYLYSAEVPGTTALYRCDKGGGLRFLTVSSICEIGITPETHLGFVGTDAACGGAPLYRLYNSTQRDHFYTTSDAERDNAVAVYGYVYESIAGYVYTQP